MKNKIGTFCNTVKTFSHKQQVTYKMVQFKANFTNTP